jgi:hypothetical protein
MLLIGAQSAFADGSVDINVGAAGTNRHQLTPGSGANAPNIDGYTILRVYARAGETIQMGSSAMGLGGTSDIRVYAPGTSFASTTEPGRRAPFLTDPVFATDIFSCDVGDPGTGRIAGRAEELAGPAPAPGGYTPCQFTAPADGIYAVAMVPYAIGTSATATTVANPNTSITQGPMISVWDVTVRDILGTVQPGRVFTDALELFIPTAAATASDMRAYVYTPAGQIYRVTVFNPRNKSWDLVANGSGVIDATTREPIDASFQWGPGGTVYPPTLEPTFGQAVAPQMWEGDGALDDRFPFFFRPPDPIVFSGPGGLGETRGYATTPMVPQGGLTPALAFTGAAGGAGSTVQGSGGAISIAAPQLRGQEYAVTLDLDRDGTFGGGDDVELDGTFAGPGATVNWDGRDSTGAVVPCGVDYEYEATSTLPAVHLVQSDTGSEAGIEIERLSLPADLVLGNPLAAGYDDTDPYKATAVTNTVPNAISEGTSGPTFHGWSASTGRADFTDTWVAARPVDGAGSFAVQCPAESAPPAGGVGTSGAQSGSTGAGAAGGGNGPTNQSGGGGKKRHHPHRSHPASKASPRLSLSLTASTGRARPSAVISYRLTVANPGGSVARDVEVCDDVPPGQRALRTWPTTTADDEPCWHIASLAPGTDRVFRLTAMVEPLSGSGPQRDRATARAGNVSSVAADRAIIHVAPLPTAACGSSARPLSGSPLPLRC